MLLKFLTGMFFRCRHRTKLTVGGIMGLIVLANRGMLITTEEGNHAPAGNSPNFPKEKVVIPRRAVAPNRSSPVSTEKEGTHERTSAPYIPPLFPEDTRFFDMRNCVGALGKTLEEDINVIKSYPTVTNEVYIQELGLNTYKPVDRFPDVPVILSAANVGYYRMAETLMKNLHDVMIPNFPDVKIIFYDLGLSKEQAQKMKKYCKCEYRVFPFEKFPPHVTNLREYRWKPIIIQYVMMEHPFVFYVDVSARFQPVSAETFRTMYFRPVMERGMFYRVSGWPFTHNTHKNMFAYLKEPPCLFKNITETESGVLILTRTKTIQMVMDRWVSCALDKRCMGANVPPQLHCGWPFNFDEVGVCHRYDQAFLTFMTIRLYHHDKEFPMIYEEQVSVKRGHQEKYFPD